jgi:ATP-dependent protease Clp ATPase subunit
MIKLRKLRCSFCGKKETQVSKLVAGPHVYICDECVAVASQLMHDSPDNNQPPTVQPSVWRKLLVRVQRLWRGGDVQRVGSIGVPG